MSKGYQLDQLKTLLGGNPETIREFVAFLQDDLPVQMTTLQHQVMHQAWEDAAITAHGIKVQLKYLAAEEAAALALWIENEAGGSDIQGLQSMVSDLAEAIAVICIGLRNEHQ